MVGLGGLDGLGRDGVGATDLASFQPGGQPLDPDPPQGGRGLVRGEHDDRALGGGVVEGPLQGRAVADQQVAQPVDELDLVGDQVAPVAGQQLQCGNQLWRSLDRGEVPAHAGLVGDDQGVLGVGLALTAVGAGPVDGAAGPEGVLLAVGSQQGQQQCGGPAGGVHRPPHLGGLLPGRVDQGQDLGLIVDHLRREHHLAIGVDRHRPVMPLAGVDADPYPRVRRAQARRSVPP